MCNVIQTVLLNCLQYCHVNKINGKSPLTTDFECMQTMITTGISKFKPTSTRHIMGLSKVTLKKLGRLHSPNYCKKNAFLFYITLTI